MDYIIVQEAPTELKSNEMVIKQPNFLEEVVENKGRRGVQKYATVNSLRTVLMSITDKYDNTINPYRLTLHKYEGQKFEDDNGFADIILRVIKDNDLDLVNKAVEFQVSNRSPKVDTIYYVAKDSLDGTSALIKHGFNMKKSSKSKKITKKQEDLV
jgi:hypothetical protein